MHYDMPLLDERTSYIFWGGGSTPTRWRGLNPLSDPNMFNTPDLDTTHMSAPPSPLPRSKNPSYAYEVDQDEYSLLQVNSTGLTTILDSFQRRSRTEPFNMASGGGEGCAECAPQSTASQ